MDQLLTTEQVAELLAVSERTVRRLRVPTVRLGRLVRYKAADVARFVEARRQP
jgi:excisionase family DNA binding protein